MCKSRPALLLLLLTAMLAACAETAVDDPLRRIELGGQAYEMRLPDRARVESGPLGADVDFRPGARRPKSIRLRVATEPGPETAPRRLANGAAFVTREAKTQSGGSGGDEAILRGRLTLTSGATFDVRCLIQAEFPEPRPDWCLAYLASLKPRAR